MKTLDIVGFCGSLRAASFNQMALTLAATQMPASMLMETVAWSDIPPFNGDVLAEGMPAAVAALRERVRRADGLLIVTPEYNFSLPGVFKNVLDWLSRGDDQPLAGKPVAIMSASMGPLGGARVQYELRKVLLAVNSMVLVKPEVFIGAVHTKFDKEGQCIDATTSKFVVDQLGAFEKWIRTVQAIDKVTF